MTFPQRKDLVLEMTIEQSEVLLENRAAKMLVLV